MTRLLSTLAIAATNDDLDHFNTAASLMVLIKKLHADGSIYVWKVTVPEVHVSGDIAWITYVNRGSVENKSGKKIVAWLESAVLRKESGTWRIPFFHSTRVP